jgi:hypothetical protein
MTRMRWFTGLTAVCVAVSLPVVAQAASFKATLKTPHGQPRANHNYVITVTATSNAGKPLKATAYYEFLFQSQVMSTQYPSPGQKPGTRHSPWSFTGHYTDELQFPARAEGIPLTLRVVVSAKGHGTINLDKAVRVGK